MYDTQHLQKNHRQAMELLSKERESALRKRKEEQRSLDKALQKALSKVRKKPL